MFPGLNLLKVHLLECEGLAQKPLQP